MCGITGWIDWEQDLRNHRPVINRMTETMTNRGPDDFGIWLSPRAALGHRRLSVIDPENGKQPMVRQRGEQTFVITYNGELYNARELRKKLQSRGYTFHTQCDTEVLLVAFMEWSEACYQYLNGIFAFGIWQEPQQRLFLCRDRMGVKPLFYTQKGSMFLFGSELKALLAHPALELRIDREGLAEVLVLGPGRTPGHGVFKGVSELRPGQCMVYDRHGARARKYWTLESKPHRDDLETTAGKIHQLVRDTVEKQLVSDVPICTLLSGGLDSSAITAFAAKAFNRSGQGPVHTFSVDYVDNDNYFKPSEFQPNSDNPWIEKVSRLLGTRHHSVVIDIPQLVDSLTTAVSARDLPGMADVDSSLYLFCREIKKEATVALSGECADEIFGGYPWFNSPEALAAETFPWSRSLQQRMLLFSPELVDYMRPEEYMERRYRETLAEVPYLPGETAEESRLREICYLTMNWFMATLLDRKDRMSMATGLEVRVPFCDHRLVEYVWNIPWWMKQCDNIEKGILRRALAGLLPGDVLSRRKSPYPKTHNPAYLEAVRERFKSIIEDDASPLVPLLNMDTVQEFINLNDDAFDRPWYGQLMTGPQLFAYLIQVDTWLREYNIAL